MLDRATRSALTPSSPFSVIIAVPDTTLHERRLETSYTVQLGWLIFIH